MLRSPRFAITAAIVLFATPAEAAEPIDLAVGYYHACVLYPAGDVWCWGRSPTNGAPEDSAVARRVEGLPATQSISAGRFATCAVVGDGELWCWGFNAQAVRDEDVVSPTPFRIQGLPPVEDAATGWAHQCALSRDGEVWCWGSNHNGELGDGTTESREAPKSIPGLTGVRSVSAGINNTCAALKSGKVKCWGSDFSTSASHSHFLFDSTTPVDIPGVSRVQKVANGRNFMCGLRDDGAITCWGSNVMKQVGTEKPRLSRGMGAVGEVDLPARASDVAVGPFAACAMAAGRAICWGAGLSDEMFGDPPRRIENVTGATSVGFGDAFGCALAGAQVLCFGRAPLPVDLGVDPATPHSAVPIRGLPG